ncbi:unnamed protein product, partial [marine sediment metagenome]
GNGTDEDGVIDTSKGNGGAAGAISLTSTSASMEVNSTVRSLGGSAGAVGTGGGTAGSGANLLFIADNDMTIQASAAISSAKGSVGTGGSAGNINLVADNATPASVGSGQFTVATGATTTCATDSLKIYTSRFNLNSITTDGTPLNGAAFTGDGSQDVQNKYGVYYPAGSVTGGEDYAVFYKAFDGKGGDGGAAGTISITSTSVLLDIDANILNTGGAGGDGTAVSGVIDTSKGNGGAAGAIS